MPMDNNTVIDAAVGALMAEMGDDKRVLKQIKKHAKRQRGDMARIIASLQDARDYDTRLREAHNRRKRRVQAELEAITIALRCLITADPHRDLLVDRLTKLIISLGQPLMTEMGQPAPSFCGVLETDLELPHEKA